MERKLKTAICYSGQLGPFEKVLGIQKRSFLNRDWDAFVYTSSLISQKSNGVPTFVPVSEVNQYLPGHQGWRKNLDTYGIIYQISKEDVEKQLSGLGNQIKSSFIENESLQDSLKDSHMSKWEWLKKRQLRKMYNCNQLRKNYEQQNNIEYDLVVRSRFDFGPNIPIDVEGIYNKAEDRENKLFAFGGWECVPPMIFMDKFFCDGFVFGSPRVIDKLSSLFLKEEAYPFDKRFKETWEKYGDNVEYQIEQHLKQNGIEIYYVGKERSMYHLYRS